MTLPCFLSLLRYFQILHELLSPGISYFLKHNCHKDSLFKDFGKVLANILTFRSKSTITGLLTKPHLQISRENWQCTRCLLDIMRLHRRHKFTGVGKIVYICDVYSLSMGELE